MGGLPKSAQEHTLTSYLEQFGKLAKMQFKYDEAGVCKGFAFVTFQDPAVAKSVIAASAAGSTMFEGKWIACKEVGDDKGKGDKGKGGDKGFGKSGGDKGFGKSGGDKGFGKGGSWNGGWDGGSTNTGGGDPKIFVGSLPRTATEDSIRQAFATYGEVRRVTIKYGDDGYTPKGYCFVEFADANIAQQVMAASQAGSTMVDGKWVDCKPSNPATAGGAKGGKDKGKGKGGWSGGGGGGGWQDKRQKTDEWGGWSQGGGGNRW